MTDITLPLLGESVTEGTITRWFKNVGDSIAMDEPLFEVSTDKVDSEVPSPVAGVVTEIVVPEGETIEVGTVVAKVGQESEQGEAPAAPEDDSADQPTVDEAQADEPSSDSNGSSGGAHAGEAPVVEMPTAETPSTDAVDASTGDAVDVSLPMLGESVTEGTITRWFKNVGDSIAMDEPLFEVSTDKVDSEVPSPVAGVVTEIVVPEGETIEVGTVVARVGQSGAAASSGTQPSSATGTESAGDTAGQPDTPSRPDSPAPAPAAAASPPEPAPADEPEATQGSRADLSGFVLSPVVRRLINENQLDPKNIEGTGLGGRITRKDVEKVIQGLRASGTPAPAASAAAAAPAAASASAAAPAAKAQGTAPARPAAAPSSDGASSGRDAESVPLNNIRKRTGEHMVMSKATSPHVLTAMEVDFENVEVVRRRHKSEWKSEEGFSLTYLPFILRAVADAIRDFPFMNASLSDGEVVIHPDVNVAIAVDLNFDGLLAPVVKNVAGKRLRQLSRDVVDVATRARSKQVTPDDLSGGTFTITNPGQYGTMMQFPIINQPQVAILSTDGVHRKPVVVEDSFGGESIAIHSVGVLALAWDHRAFDGAYAAAFLARMREIIEETDWEAEIT